MAKQLAKNTISLPPFSYGAYYCNRMVGISNLIGVDKKSNGDIEVVTNIMDYLRSI